MPMSPNDIAPAAHQESISRYTSGMSIQRALSAPGSVPQGQSLHLKENAETEEKKSELNKVSRKFFFLLALLTVFHRQD